MNLANGWERESATLFVHESGARISKATYRGKVAWWFFPVSLDIPAVEYPPTDAGLDEAFNTSGKGLPKVRSGSKSGRKPKKTSEPRVAEVSPSSSEAPDEDAEDESEEDGD